MTNQDLKINPQLRHLISAKVANSYRIVPAVNGEDDLVVLTDSPENLLKSLTELEVILGKKVKAEAVSKDQLDTWLSLYFGSSEARLSGKTIRVNQADFLDNLIEETVQLKGSDIHMELYERTGRIRVRVNGKLIERYQVNHDQYPELINKVKIRGKMDIAERRLPQDGRIKYTSDNQDYDIRVSILPAHYGEKAVLRILGQDASHLSIENLGFNTEELNAYRTAIQKPNGMVLISGPTGSGKTTTLYATLKELNGDEVNITTIEDPIEYTLSGINQVQLNEKVGLDFASAMRTFLRQDPDIIMVGEIRDIDTAKMATRAALTGHLVFSTIHTNSALGIFTRLTEMGIAPYLLTETLNAGIAQRLIRILCGHCKKPETSQQLPEGLKGSDITTYQPVGCSECLGTGYSHRKAIYEIIPGDEAIFSGLEKGSAFVASILKERNIRTLKENALTLYADGDTSISEITPYIL